MSRQRQTVGQRRRGAGNLKYDMDEYNVLAGRLGSRSFAALSALRQCIGTELHCQWQELVAVRYDVPRQ